MATRRRVVVEADGGSRGNPGPAAFGSVLWDADTQELIAETGETIGIATNNVAEYRGLIGGLELYVEHAPGAQLEVRMDSKLLVEQMAGRWRVKHPDLKPLAIRARRLAPPDTTWTWIPREQNTHADRLVNEALDGFPTATAPRGRSADAGTQSTEGGTDGGAAPSTGARNPLLGWSGQLGTPTTLVLIRHGATSHTEQKKFSGPGGEDPALSDAGRDQSARLAEYLRSRVDPRWDPVDAIVSSPMRRTRQTADVVAAALGLSVDVLDDLREAAFGDWDGHTLAEVEERWPAELDAWIASFDARPPGGGESVNDVAARVDVAVAQIRERYRDRTVAVVSHVNPIKRIVQDTLAAPPDVMNRMQLVPGSLSVVQSYSSGATVLRVFSALP
jgi:ribonuclease H / adenosylcobalamin/alpha-ribazole phosphatase